MPGSLAWVSLAPPSSPLLVTRSSEHHRGDAVGFLQNSYQFFPGVFVAPEEICMPAWLLLAQMHPGDPTGLPELLQLVSQMGS